MKAGATALADGGLAARPSGRRRVVAVIVSAALPAAAAVVAAPADPSSRALIMGHLHQAKRCAADGRDQYFGIPQVVPGPWAVKQGWSGFGRQPADTDCRHPGPDTPAAGPYTLMHTSGTICADDRKIMVVLTRDPAHTTWQNSADHLTALTAGAYQRTGC
jgi:hypothetical protein